MLLYLFVPPLPLCVIIQQLLNEVNVGEDHPPTAVPLAAEHIERVFLIVLRLEVVKVGLPLVANHLAAGEAADWDDHSLLL